MPPGSGLGIGEHRFHLTDFRHHAAVQNGNPVANLLNHGHLVGDENHGNLPLPADVLQQIQNGIGGLGIQGRGGLIAQQHLRVGSQSAGNGNALLLTAGQLHRVGICLVGQTHNIQQLLCPCLCLGSGHSRQLHGEADVIQGCALLQQVEALENHGNLPAHLPQLLGGHGH